MGVIYCYSLDKEDINLKATVLGTGSWGTALAQVLDDNGHQVVMYGVDNDEITEINQRHTNSRYFHGVKLSSTLTATADAAQAMEGCEMVLITVPTKFVSDALHTIKPYVKEGTLVVNASKGFDINTDKRMTETVKNILGECGIKPVVSVIGPSHAEEVILRRVTCICSVSTDIESARLAQHIFSNDYMRLYVNSDEVGAEYAVAIKNVIALASGMLSGLGYGDNSRAALVTRGLAEMIRYCTAKGGKSETCCGLAGVGDLMVTCFSPHSRNYQAGYIIGQDDSSMGFLRDNKKTVEGVYSCKVIYEDARKNYDFDLPIINGIYDILFNGKHPSDALHELMARPLTEE